MRVVLRDQGKSSVNPFGPEHRQLPGVRSLIVADEIRVAIGTSQLEVPVLWCQPRIEHLGDGDATVTKDQRAWRLLAAMAGVAFNANSEEALITHLTIAALLVAHRKSIAGMLDA